jgi:hypothetical protein
MQKAKEKPPKKALPPQKIDLVRAYQALIDGYIETTLTKIGSHPISITVSTREKSLSE